MLAASDGGSVTQEEGGWLDVDPRGTIYVADRFSHHGIARRVTVIAARAWLVLPAPPLPGTEPPTRTHASPREHKRSGHWRRIAIGSPRERLIHVRATIVRPTASSGQRSGRTKGATLNST